MTGPSLPRLAVPVLATLALITGCSQPGTPVSKAEAAKLDVATNRISVACGYAAELTAFGGPHARGLATIEAIAQSGAAKLAGVYGHDRSDIYEGESIGGIVNDSISLLGDCGLPRARKVLQQALAGR